MNWLNYTLGVQTFADASFNDDLPAWVDRSTAGLRDVQQDTRIALRD